MSEYQIKAKYLTYILKRCVYPYQDFPKDKTIDFETFKKTLLNK